MILSKKADSATIASKRLGVSLIDGRLPAVIIQPRAKFVGGLRKAHTTQPREHVMRNRGIATSWPTNNAR